VEKLGRHIASYDEFLQKMGGSLATTVNHYNNAYGEFKKIDKDVIRITDGDSQIEALKVDRPKNDE
jgi:DNA recombination protein RmuC